MADDITLRLGAEVAAAASSIEAVQKKMSSLANEVKQGTPIYDAYGRVASQATGSVAASTTKLDEAQKKVASLAAGVKAGAPAYETLGKSSTAATDKIAEGSEKATKSTGLLRSGWGQLVTAFAAANLLEKGVSFLTGIASGAIKAAGELVDLRGTTDMSLEFLQRMSHVAKTNGSDLTQYTDTIFKMGLQVSKGGQETKDAVERMGLSWAEFRRMSPEDQFLAIADNINFAEPR